MVERFPVVLRGYDKERVDEAMLAAQTTIDRLREQVKAGDDNVLQLQAQLQEEKNRKASTDNTFASLGANAQQMLASAEQTSTELLERAKKDAASARVEAQSQSQTLINNAKLDAQHLVDDAQAKADTLLKNAQNEAQTIITSAQQEAAQLRASTAKTVKE